MVLNIMKIEYFFIVLELHIVEYLVFLPSTIINFLLRWGQHHMWYLTQISHVVLSSSQKKINGSRWQKKKKKEKKKKNKILDFVKLEYYKKVLDFHNIEYHIAFLIAQIPGKQCHASDSPRSSSLRNSSTI